MQKQLVARGELDLPDINLDSNDEYEECWCLVDTGAGLSSANRARHFPGAELIQPDPNEEPVTLSTASGQILTVKGTFKVEGYSSEQQQFSTKFTDSKVDMPILAGSAITLGGTAGREIIITKRGGIIKDLATGETSHIVRRRGVYFMKLKIPKKYTEARPTGVTRQGSP